MDVLALVVTCGLAARAALFVPLAGPPACMNPAFTTHGNARDAAAAWQPETVATAHRFDIPAAWIAAVMRAESGGQATVDGEPIRSPAGAIGLVQVMPQTYAAACPLRARRRSLRAARQHPRPRGVSARAAGPLRRALVPRCLQRRARRGSVRSCTAAACRRPRLSVISRHWRRRSASHRGVAAGSRDYGSEHEVCSGGSFPGPERCRRRRPLRDRNHASRRASGTRGAADRETEFGADACADGGGGWSDCSQT